MTTWTRAASLFTCLGVAACAANATAPVCPPAAPRAVASLPSASAAPADSAAPVASNAPVAPPSASAPPAPTPTAVPSSPAEPPKPKRNPYAEGSVYYTEDMFKFNLRLTLGKECDEAAYLAFECKQPGTLEILEKETGKLLQTIALDEVRVAPDEAMGLNIGIVNGYGSIPGTLAIEDYNFDGEPDIAVVRNDWGLYRGPMYTVFLWDKRKKRYVLNKPLTELTETDIVSFNPDKKLVSAMWKDGCCNHVYRDFRMVNNRPVLIYKLVMKEGDQHEERLVHGVWKRRKVSGDEPDLHP